MTCLRLHTLGPQRIWLQVLAASEAIRITGRETENQSMDGTIDGHLGCKNLVIPGCSQTLRRQVTVQNKNKNNLLVFCPPKRFVWLS